MIDARRDPHLAVLFPNPQSCARTLADAMAVMVAQSPSVIRNPDGVFRFDLTGFQLLAVLAYLTGGFGNTGAEEHFSERTR